MTRKPTMITETEKGHPSVHAIHMPAPTVWPFVLAIGVTFLFAGLVTTWAVSVLGLVLMLFGSVGWFRNVFPHEQHESVSVTTEMVEIKSSREQVARLPAVGSHRKLLPVERYTLSAGVEGGLAGGVAMIAPATMYGLIRFHSLWYAPNLLAAMAIPGWAERSASFLSSFHLEGLLVAVVVHCARLRACRPSIWRHPSHVSLGADCHCRISGAHFLERTLVWWISRREPDHESAD